ncbi:MAG: hypothetical protein AB7J28_12370 [Hyphomonadaceae bacterium]
MERVSFDVPSAQLAQRQSTPIYADQRTVPLGVRQVLREEELPQSMQRRMQAETPSPEYGPLRKDV